MKQPLVSISCITYNHVNYIKQCLDGFLMQQCNFDYEILIHDDASTDGTSDIILEYQKKYPHIIKPIIQSQNQWSKGVRGMNATFNFSRAQGKYIALCEGDDYWIDPLKLQKQVDFLEENIEYSLVTGGYTSNNTITKEKKLFNEVILNAKGFDITLDIFLQKWCTQTLTLMFRKEALDLNELLKYKYIRDVHMNYLLLKNSKGYYLNENFGIYQIHEGGIFSLTSVHSKAIMGYNVYSELYNNHKYHHELREAYKASIRRMIDLNLGKDFFFKILFNHISLLRNKKDIKYLIKFFLNLVRN